MKKLLNVIMMVLIFASGSALAAGTVPAEENGFVVMLFLGFLALLIVMQLLPGLVLFISMIKGLFSQAPRETLVTDKKPGKSF